MLKNPVKSCIDRHYKCQKSMGECNTILSAYTKYRHLGKCCSHPSKCALYKREHIVSEKRMVQGQPVQSVQADLVQNCVLLAHFLHV